MPHLFGFKGIYEAHLTQEQLMEIKKYMETRYFQALERCPCKEALRALKRLCSHINQLG